MGEFTAYSLMTPSREFKERQLPAFFYILHMHQWEKMTKPLDNPAPIYFSISKYSVQEAMKRVHWFVNLIKKNTPLVQSFS